MLGGPQSLRKRDELPPWREKKDREIVELIHEVPFVHWLAEEKMGDEVTFRRSTVICSHFWPSCVLLCAIWRTTYSYISVSRAMEKFRGGFAQAFDAGGYDLYPFSQCAWTGKTALSHKNKIYGFCCIPDGAAITSSCAQTRCPFASSSVRWPFVFLEPQSLAGPDRKGWSCVFPSAKSAILLTMVKGTCLRKLKSWEGEEFKRKTAR